MSLQEDQFLFPLFPFDKDVHCCRVIGASICLRTRYERALISAVNRTSFMPCKALQLRCLPLSQLYPRGQLRRMVNMPDTLGTARCI